MFDGVLPDSAWVWRWAGWRGTDCRTRLARSNSQTQMGTGRCQFSLFSWPRAGLATLPGWSLPLLYAMTVLLWMSAINIYSRPYDMGAPICNIVLQHFYCNMVDAIRTIPQEALFGSLLLWFFALVLAGCCCQLVCFEFWSGHKMPSMMSLDESLRRKCGKDGC